jgi:hypothetical protein
LCSWSIEYESRFWCRDRMPSITAMEKHASVPIASANHAAGGADWRELTPSENPSIKPRYTSKPATITPTKTSGVPRARNFRGIGFVNPHKTPFLRSIKNYCRRALDTLVNLKELLYHIRVSLKSLPRSKWNRVLVKIPTSIPRFKAETGFFVRFSFNFLVYSYSNGSYFFLTFHTPYLSFFFIPFFSGIHSSSNLEKDTFS